jgi:hypothetical protein
LWLTDNDGKTWASDNPSQNVATLSTYARFFRFAQDFLPQRRTEAHSPVVAFHTETINDRTYIVTTMRLAVEFITKKDYTDNWASEMYEEFAFWNFADWKAALHQAGFGVSHASYVYTNKWIVENRWRGRVELFQRKGDALIPLPDPPTTIVLIAEKPAAVTPIS